MNSVSVLVSCQMTHVFNACIGLPHLELQEKVEVAQPKNEIKSWKRFLEESKLEFENRWTQSFSTLNNLNDFERLKTLGVGSFGRVVLVRHVSNQRFYAMKILDKEMIIKENQVEHTFNEKKILLSIRFPFIISMEFFHKDNSYIYFLTPFIVGGELFTLLRDLGNFDESRSKFYAAQVLLGLEYLHYLGLIYRDLKPENIILDLSGYIKIVDFGLCKKVDGRTWTLCGTPDYLAPEVVLNGEYGKSIDVWAWGVLVYEMTAGYPPFYSNETIKMYENIVSGHYENAPHFSKNLKNLLVNVLQVDVTRRYGNLRRGYDDIKKHPWFKATDWLGVLNQRKKAPFMPPYNNEGDTSNFDSYKEELLCISKVEKYPEQFKDF